jgi:hypothetical protein
MFRFDRRSPRQRRAADLLVVVAALGAVAYPVLDRLLTRTLGGMWGVLVALFLVGSPLATVWRVVWADRGPRQALLDGVALAAAGAALYFWTFGAAWWIP